MKYFSLLCLLICFTCLPYSLLDAGPFSKKKKKDSSKDKEVEFDEFDLRDQMLMEHDVVILSVLKVPPKNKVPVELKKIKKIVILPLQPGSAKKSGKGAIDITGETIKRVTRELIRQLKLGGQFQISQDTSIADEETAFIGGTVWADYQLEKKYSVFKNKIAKDKSSREVIQTLPYKELSGFVKVSLMISTKNTTVSVRDEDLARATQQKAVLFSHTDSQAFKIRLQKEQKWRDSYQSAFKTTGMSTKKLSIDQEIFRSLNLSEWVISKFVVKISPAPAKLKIHLILPASTRAKNNAFLNLFGSGKLTQAKAIIDKQKGDFKDYNLGVWYEFSGEIEKARASYKKIFDDGGVPTKMIYYSGLKRINYYDKGLIKPLSLKKP